MTVSRDLMPSPKAKTVSECTLEFSMYVRRHDRGDHISVLQHPNMVAYSFVTAPNGRGSIHNSGSGEGAADFPLSGWYSKKSDGGNANRNQSKREREPQDHVKFRAGGRTCLLVRIGYS